MAGILTFALHYEGQINKNSQGAVSEAAKLSQQVLERCQWADAAAEFDECAPQNRGYM